MTFKGELETFFNKNTDEAELFMSSEYLYRQEYFKTGHFYTYKHYKTGEEVKVFPFEDLESKNPPFDSFKYLDSYGGEDCGSDYWSVVAFTKGNEEILIKFNGWYQSYHGADYQDFSFVTPKKKEITVYE